MNFGVKWVFVGVLVLLASGCASSYRPMTDNEPHGYFSETDDQGQTRVSFRTWKRWSEQRVCEQAGKRAAELGAEVAGQKPVFSVSVERRRVEEIRTFMPVAGPPAGGVTGPSTVYSVPVTLTPEYDMELEVKTCTYVL